MGICSIGCFGKLPTSHDFIRFNADGSEVRGLDEWFQEGIALAKMRQGKAWISQFERMGTWSFVFCPQRQARWVVGLYFPSRDASGRQYPFVVCVFIARSQAAASLLPVVLAQSLDDFRSIFERHIGASADELVSKLKMVALPNETDFIAAQKQYHAYLSTYQARGFWTDLFGDAEDGRKYLMFWNLWRILRAPEQASYIGSVAGLRFPLMPCPTHPNGDVAVWVHLVAGIIKQRDYVPTLFWNRASGGGGQALMLLGATHSPKQFNWLLDPGGENLSCVDLVSHEQKELQELMQRMGSSRTQILQQGELSLAAFLQTIEGMP